MSQIFAGSLDALGDWRGALTRQLDALYRDLRGHESLDPQAKDLIAALRERLSADKLVLAFVAEFSRGKSELINAIFFADTGRRILPATPGRTTMCPVELGYEDGEPPRLALLPIETRLQPHSLAELRLDQRAWTVLPLEVESPERLAQALAEVKRTRRVSVDQARQLGFWNDEQPADNPPVEDGQVEVPLWRHAVINYPHPLLERGLVVLDTPGLNAIGAEPELTLGLLPSAHATVFILGADTGVTKSDLAIWRDHLSEQTRSRFVVLNKIDTMVDPLLSAEAVQQQIEQQCASVAHTLGVGRERVFPLSARQALAGRIAADQQAVQGSHLPSLEAALATQLLPQRRQVLEHTVLDSVQQIEQLLLRRVADNRRQLAEQLLELRGLRGKSGAKLRLMLQRIDIEMAEFEQCSARLSAMRAVHGRMLKDALVDLAADRVRELVGEMHSAINASMLGLGAKKAFTRLCASLRVLLERSQRRADEIQQMLYGSFQSLNSDYGFGLAIAQGPDLSRHLQDLALIESNYAQYLGLKNALRLGQSSFVDQFLRMLTQRLRVVFEGAATELEAWNKSASAQVEMQLRDRRQGFRKRRDALERVQTAAGELEQRIGEFESQDAQAQQFEASLMTHLSGLRASARAAAARLGAEHTPVAAHERLSLGETAEHAGTAGERLRA